MMHNIYTLAVKCYALALACAAPFHNKAKLWRNGRRNDLWTHLRQQCNKKSGIIWFHCASLGEYEQGKPLMQKIKTLQPHRSLLLTFFSPSGYEIVRNDLSVADIITYLPIDTPRNATQFLDIVQPECAIFVKYEFWYNFMQALCQRQIPYYYISAIFRPSQYFFYGYGKWFAQQLQNVTHFFVQNETSEQLLHAIGITQTSCTGDTRFDRVIEIAALKQVLPKIAAFKQDLPLIVAGSSWKPDEMLLATLFSKIEKKYKMVIAPHNIDETHIQLILKIFDRYKTALYTKTTAEELSEAQILIVDCIGILSKIYRYSSLAYIGGAFKTGLHNTLEAAVFGKPIFFGTQFAKFDEAVALVRLGGAFSVANAEEMFRIITSLEQNTERYQQLCADCRQFVINHSGSAEKIYKHIFKSCQENEF